MTLSSVVHICRPKRAVLVFIAILAAIMPLRAMSTPLSDGIDVRNISVTDGLSQNSVNSVALDPLGFLWLGTDEGLDRFDGLRFVHIRNLLPPDGFDSRKNKVERVEVDALGNVWTSHQLGEIRCLSARHNNYLLFKDKDGRSLNLSTGKIRCLPDSTVLIYGATCGAALFRSMPDSDPVCLWSDTANYTVSASLNGTLWLCGKKLTLVRNDGDGRTIDIEGMSSPAVSVTMAGKMAVISDGTSRLRRIDLLTGRRLPDVVLLADGVTSLATLSESKVLAVHSSLGISVIDAQSGSLLPLSSIGAGRLASEKAMLKTDNADGVWLCCASGAVFHYDEERGVMRNAVTLGENSQVAVYKKRFSILCDSFEPGVYWISSLGGGLYRYDENIGISELVVSKNSYVPEFINCICQDKGGNIWLGSDNIGLVKISLHRYVTYSLRPGVSTHFSASNDVISVFEAADGNVWMGTRQDGLYVYDSSLKNKLFHDASVSPTSMVADGRGRMWLATSDSGVYIYEMSTFAQVGHLTHKADEFNSLSSNGVVKVIADRDGRIWLVLSNGRVDMIENVGKFNLRCRHFVVSDSNALASASDATIDSEGLIWVATDAGLVCFAPQRLVKDATDYVKYKFDNNEQGQLPTGTIRTICEDGHKRIYVGMVGGGLCRLTFDVGHVHLSRYTEGNGLPSDEVTAIACSDDSTLWVATENGLSLFNVHTETFSNVRTADTEFGNIFNSHACFNRANGNILWGTVDGLVDLDPKIRLLTPHTNLPALSEVIVDNKRIIYFDNNADILDAAAPYATKINIPVSFGELTLRVADKGLSGGRLSDLAYMLEGVDDDWRSMPQDREVTYHKLEPGSYSFLVYDRAGGLSTMKAVTVNVMRQWWVCLLKGLGVVSAIVLIIVLPFAVTQFHRRKSVEALADEKSAEFRDAMLQTITTEVLSPIKKIKNSLTSISEMRNGVSNEARPLMTVINRNVAQLSDMVDSMLAQKDAVAQMPLNLETTHMATFLGDIVNNFDSQLVKKKKISTRLNVAGGWRVLADRDKLSKTIQILLADAYKNAPVGGEVSISAYQNPNLQCIIEIEDDGQGVPYDRRRTIFSASMSAPRNDIELSLSAVSDYVKSHHGEVRYTPRDTGGTQMTVILPTDYSAYTDANIVSSPIEQNSDDDLLFSNQSLSSIEEQARTPSVLIVDDKQEMRDFLADRLRPYFSVATADSVRSAQGKVAASTPDLVVCDAFMEPRNGNELLHFMKRDFNLSHVPFFMIAADAKSLDCDTTGCFAPDLIIEKPVDYASLVANAVKVAKRVMSLRLNFDKLYGVIGEPPATDVNFMSAVVGCVIANSPRVNFGIDDLAAEMHLSSDDIFKKVSELTGCTPGEYVKLWRLDRARKAIASGRETSTIAMQNSGVTDVDYFNKCFIRIYGDLPTVGMPNIR